jgi:hypothetical protein
MKTSYRGLITAGLVDSTLKLRLLLLFYRQPRLCGTAGGLSQRLCESPWAVEEALEALTERGFLSLGAGEDGRSYRLVAQPAHQAFLQWLVICDNEPYRHDDIYALVRAVEQERRFHTWWDGVWELEVGGCG